MSDSILDSIKKMLGIEAEYTHFDTDIIININSVLMILTQLGVGPDAGFIIEDSSKTWADFLGEGISVPAVKTYVYLKVKLVFDPPASSYVVDAMERQILELEWRVNVKVDKEEVEVNDGVEL